MVCGILVPQPGMEPVPPTMEAWSLNHWTVREAPGPRLYSTCAPTSEEQSCCPQVAFCVIPCEDYSSPVP